MYRSILFVVLVSLGFVSAVEYGICHLRGNDNDVGITGNVYFVNDGTLVRVFANITGITQNDNIPHAMHVHEFGDLTSTTSLSAGGHYVGAGASTHGCYPDASRHAGDMGNWNVIDGTILQNSTFDLLSLSSDNSIIGRAVILHLFTDNCVNVSSAQGRIAHCAIGVGNPTTFPPIFGTGITNTAVNPNPASANYNRAVCVLRETTLATAPVTGTVFATQTGNTVNVQVVATGLGGTIHGIHVHQYGDLSSLNGDSAGMHYNPGGAGVHNLPAVTTRHVGDMGNIGCSKDDTNAYYYYDNTFVTLQGSNNLVGLAVVIHAIPDNGGTTYGSRIAHCVLGLANPTTVAPTIPAGFANNNNVTCGFAPSQGTTTTGGNVSPTTGNTASITEISMSIVLVALVLIAWF
eukprot:TRINITY_DN256_c0_g1_i2.p1 TRINITY_DN256_c0_g1~~TRINITY_DN256_c0_g1_i2.p1  ORF type:complete len:418 (-),score=95.76 TRINITY_DN256_c0_g1_i2:141-1355(-)